MLALITVEYLGPFTDILRPGADDGDNRMRVYGLITALSLTLASTACLDDGSGPTPLVNTQLAQMQTQIEELEHEVAACYAGKEIERGDEAANLPPTR